MSDDRKIAFRPSRAPPQIPEYGTPPPEIDFDFVKHEYWKMKENWLWLAAWYEELSEWERYLYQQSHNRTTYWNPKSKKRNKSRRYNH